MPKKFLIILMVITIGSKYLATAQSLEQTLTFAMSEMEEGNYESAHGLYSRVLFFDTLGVYEQQTISGLAYTNLFKGNWKASGQHFLSSYTLSRKTEYLAFHVICLVQQGLLIEAKSYAFMLPSTTKEEQDIKNILLGLIAFRLENFEDVNRYLAKVSEKVAPFDLQQLQKDVTKIQHKKKVKAIVLSGILPGLGQAYTGHYADGINSFLVVSTTLVAYFAVNIYLGPVDAIISVLPWFLRYYMGGMNKAGSYVEEHQKDEMEKLYGEVLDHYRLRLDSAIEVVD